MNNEIDITAEVANIRRIQQDRELAELQRREEARVQALEARRERLRRNGDVYDPFRYSCRPLCELCMEDILKLKDPRHKKD